jgi:hypothetical protein
MDQTPVMAGFFGVVRADRDRFCGFALTGNQR